MPGRITLLAFCAAMWCGSAATAAIVLGATSSRWCWPTPWRQAVFGDSRRASISQVALAARMVLCTLFGLRLLSTPVAG